MVSLHFYVDEQKMPRRKKVCRPYKQETVSAANDFPFFNAETRRSRWSLAVGGESSLRPATLPEGSAASFP